MEAEEGIESFVVCCALCIESLVVRTSSLAGSHGHSHFCTALSNVSLEHWAPPWSKLPPAGWPRHNQGFACCAMCAMRRQCLWIGDNETWKTGQTQYNVPESVVYLGSQGSKSHEILAMTNLNTLQQQKYLSRRNHKRQNLTVWHLVTLRQWKGWGRMWIIECSGYCENVPRTVNSPKWRQYPGKVDGVWVVGWAKPSQARTEVDPKTNCYEQY